MTKVPNYKATPPPEPDSTERTRLRKAKSKREHENRLNKAQIKREEYWLNNPIYKFPEN